jgi:hypothetical protein
MTREKDKANKRRWKKWKEEVYALLSQDKDLRTDDRGAGTVAAGFGGGDRRGAGCRARPTTAV